MTVQGKKHAYPWNIFGHQFWALYEENLLEGGKVSNQPILRQLWRSCRDLKLSSEKLQTEQILFVHSSTAARKKARSLLGDKGNMERLLSSAESKTV